MPFEQKIGRSRTTTALADPAFPALKAQVIARTGHHYYADKDDLLFDRLAKRFKVLNLANSAGYLAYLDGPGGRAEWAALEAEITIGETFFFRYAEQFAALRERILPGLIAARRADRTLRIWSAGCSTGAEPYSIAILLRELLGPELAAWNIGIVGTDISVAALASARTGEYGAWALRTTAREDRLRWFVPVPPKPGSTRAARYRLRTEYRQMVRFERRNLMELVDGSMASAFSAFDLILCRNVLIYFSHEHVLGMMRGFADRLRPGGWLLIGHAEPNPAFDAWLTPVSLPGTAAYRRGDEPVLPGLSKNAGWSVDASTVAVVAPVIAEFLPQTVKLVEPIMLAGPPEVAPVATISSASTETLDDPLPRIRALADAGETGEAWRELRKAIDVDPTAAPLRYYEGLLAQSLGRGNEAEKALRGALFLDRDFVMAHLQLGLMLSGLGRRASAVRSLDNALQLAQRLPPEAILPEGDGVTAGELIGTASRVIEGLGRATR